MKKILAMILAMLLVLSMTAAFAAEGDFDTLAQTTITKVYTKAAGGNPKILPNETLEFDLNKLTDGAPDLEFGTITVNETDTTYEYTLTVSVDVAETPIGVYEYELTEKPGNNQGEVYSNETIGLKLYVYATEAPSLGATKPEGSDEKFDTFTNTYDVGDLKVSKTISGKLASPEQAFTIKVDFASEKPVYNTISYKADGAADTTKDIAGNGWTSQSVTITLVGTHNVEFINIPEGVTYTVTEDSGHARAGEELTPDEMNDPAAGYLITYTDPDGDDKTDGAGSIAADDTDEVVINNDKDTEIDTGIILQYAPFIAILAVVLAGAALMIIRRRRNNED